MKWIKCISTTSHFFKNKLICADHFQQYFIAHWIFSLHWDTHVLVISKVYRINSYEYYYILFMLLLRVMLWLLLYLYRNTLFIWVYQWTLNWKLVAKYLVICWITHHLIFHDLMVDSLLIDCLRYLWSCNRAIISGFPHMYA